jgi:hypothetical protein
MKYARIELSNGEVKAWEEERPEISNEPYKEAVPENNTNRITDYTRRLSEWQSKGKVFKCYPGEHEKLLCHIINNTFPEGGRDITAFCEIKQPFIFNDGSYYNRCSLCKEYFMAAKRQPVCKSCCDTPLAFFKEPVKEQDQAHKCESGCKVFTGGEIKHHEDCFYYPESLSERIKELEKQMSDSLKLYECQNQTIIKRNKEIESQKQLIEELKFKTENQAKDIRRRIEAEIQIVNQLHALSEPLKDMLNVFGVYDRSKCTQVQWDTLEEAKEALSKYNKLTGSDPDKIKE